MSVIRGVAAAAAVSCFSLVGLAGAARADGGIATGDTSKMGIALSTYELTNTWHQEMVDTYQKAAKKAIAEKLIAKTRAVDAQGSASQQASQISNLIIEGWNAIILDAASPTALNGVIQQACDAHILVVVFDALATAPCAYKVTFDYYSYGQQESEYVANMLHGKGNVLEIRGLAGTSSEADMHRGNVETLAKYPGIKVVGSVYGQWTQTIAQREVASILPTLPHVDAVVTQGGDGWGVYEAFKEAGRPIPLIIMGNRQDELALWAQLRAQPGGYKTFSITSPPGIASVAFWEAQQILAGKKVPQKIVMPLLVIHDDTLSAWLADTPKGGVATPVYTQKWTADMIDDVIAGRPIPPPEPPKTGDAQ